MKTNTPRAFIDRVHLHRPRAHTGQAPLVRLTLSTTARIQRAPGSRLREPARVILLVVILLGMGLLPFTSPASAQSKTGLQMTAIAAYDGNFKYGEWLPIWVDLQNQGADLEGDVRITISGSQGSLVFDAPVSLPSGSHKRVPVYVLPNNFSRELNVQLVSQDKVVASQKTAIRPQPNISYFVGLLAPERGALSLLSGMRFSGQERQKVLVDLRLDELPERPEALRSFDLLIFNDMDTSKLSPAQAAALAGWVQQGGRLVIGGGAGAQQTVSGLPAEMLPFKLQGSGEIKPEALQPLAGFAKTELASASGPFIITRTAAAGGQAAKIQTLVASQDMPLVQEWSLGSGKMDYVALDLTGVPFNGWPGTTAFWENLIGPSGSYPENMPFDMSMRQYRANMLVYPLSNIPSLDLPSIRGLSILLGIYIIIIGPINYLVLRRLRRLHLAWVTIPIITLLFSGAAFGIGYTLRGNDLILNRVALVEVRSDGNAAVTSYMGLFSPRMQTYEITVNAEAQDFSLVSPMAGPDQAQFGVNGMAVNGTGGEMVFIQGQPSKVKGLSVNQWAMQSFMAEGTWSGFGSLTGSLHMENDVLLGTVRNDSRYTIKDVVLTLQSRFVRLGDMAPGEEKSVNLGMSSTQSDRFGPPLGYRLYQQQYPNGPMPRDVELKANIISNVFENGPWAKFSSSFRSPSTSMMGGTDPITVFGWLDQAPPTVEVSSNRLTQKTTALVYTSLSYALPENGPLVLPPGLIPGSVVKMPPNSGNCGSPSSIQMQQGQADFEFQLPTNLLPENSNGFQVQTLKVAVWRDNVNAPTIPDIALYDWQNQAWTMVQEPVQGTNLIKNADPYVSQSGLIRLQLTSKNDNFGCVYIDLGMEADRTSGQGVK